MSGEEHNHSLEPRNREEGHLRVICDMRRVVRCRLAPP